MADEEFRKRTFQFGIRCIRLIESLPKTTAAQFIGKQLLRSATSVGANYRAAIRARSRADFIAKMGIVEEECDSARVADLRCEADAILAITVSSIKTARKNSK